MRLDQLLAPRTVTFWGEVHHVTPALVNQTWGDGQKLLQLFPINERPNHWVVRVDSSCDNDNLFDILDDIYDAIDDQFGRPPEDDDGIGDERPYFPRYDGQGTSWHLWDTHREEAGGEL